MKYRCSKCMYEFDEDIEGESFDNLPEHWRCPECGGQIYYFEKAKIPQTVFPAQVHHQQYLELFQGDDVGESADEQFVCGDEQLIRRIFSVKRQKRSDAKSDLFLFVV